MTQVGLRVNTTMSPEERIKAREAWSKYFEDLKRYGVPYKFTPRELAGLYAVASICYDDGNHSPLIEDDLFDRLCKWLYDHYDECVADGANLLDRDLLRCCSGYDTTIFVKPYHEVAEVFLVVHANALNAGVKPTHKGKRIRPQQPTIVLAKRQEYIWE